MHIIVAVTRVRESGTDRRVSVSRRAGGGAPTCKTSTSRRKLARSPRAALRATGSSCSPPRAIILTATSIPSLSRFATRASQTWLKAPCPIRRRSSYDSSSSLSGCTNAPGVSALGGGTATAATGASDICICGCGPDICGPSIAEGEETRISGGSIVINPRGGCLLSVRRTLEEYREGKRRDSRGTWDLGTGVLSASWPCSAGSVTW